MELRYYATNFVSGRMYTTDLPLEGVSLSRTQDGTGTLSASLDLRRLTDQVSDMAEVLTVLRPAVASIVAVREGTDRAGALQYTVMGEWWVTKLEQRHSTQILAIDGEEFGGFFSRVLAMKAIKKSQWDALHLMIQTMQSVVAGNCGVMPAITLSSPSMCGQTIESEVIPGTTTIAAMLNDLQGDGLWEWRMRYSVIMDATEAYVKRTMEFAVPKFSAPPNESTFLEAIAPGGAPGQIIEVIEDLAADDFCHDLWGFGAGSGTGQITRRFAHDRLYGEPTISRTITASDALHGTKLGIEMARAMRKMDPRFAPFTVVIDLDTLPPFPEVGAAFYWGRDATLALPTTDRGILRVKAWQWPQPTAGQRETVSCSVVREYL